MLIWGSWRLPLSFRWVVGGSGGVCTVIFTTHDCCCCLGCDKIKPGADFLLETLKFEIPDLTLERIKYLVDFRCEDLLVPTYLTAATLSQLWISRYYTRNFSWQSVRVNVEQNNLTLRKSRFTVAASKIHTIWNANVLVHDTVEK